MISGLVGGQRGQVLGAETSLISKPVVIIDNGVENHYLSSGNTLEEIFTELGIKVFPEDKVSVLVDPGHGAGTLIKIRRATLIIVDDGGAVKSFRTFKETVIQLLDEKGIKLAKLDRISPDQNTILANKMKVRIVRVRQEDRTEKESIEYQTIHQDDPTIFYGQKQVCQTGARGEKEVRYRLTFENGRLVDKTAVSEKILNQPKNKVVCQGTKPYSTQIGWASWHSGATASRNYHAGTKLKVINLDNDRSTITTVGGWGPQESTGRIIDLNINTFSAIASLGAGVIRVRVEEIG